MRRRLRAPVLPLFWAVAAAAATGGGCEDRSDRDQGAQINLLTQRTDALVPAAIRRLAAFGKRALPQIEIALHTAPAAGKNNLLGVIDAIGDPESIAILRHFAVYDPHPEVRTACEEVLKGWAAKARSPDEISRAGAARTALALVADRRARGEGPVIVGERSARQ